MAESFFKGALSFEPQKGFYGVGSMNDPGDDRISGNGAGAEFLSDGGHLSLAKKPRHKICFDLWKAIGIHFCQIQARGAT